MDDRGHAEGRRVIGYITVHKTASAHDGIFSDDHAGHYDGMAPDLAIFFQCHSAFFAVNSRDGIDRTVRPDLNVILYDDAELCIDIGKRADVQS